MEWKRSRNRSLLQLLSFNNERRHSLPIYVSLLLLFFFFFSSFSAPSASMASTTTTSRPGIGGPLMSGKADSSRSQGSEKSREKENDLSIARRFLGGPGSSPPRCTSKCGNCTPCTPVHVPVPPGTPVTAEYYPEAWRCKCGNKLYMP